MINWLNSCNDNLFASMTHCRRARFAVLWSCSGELAVHLCPLIGMQKQVAKLTSGLFCCWSLLRNVKHGNKHSKVHFVLR